ncbi:MAG TPA: hypothetical protein VM597_21920, partial [Gemmataceae bacterium]|nr:hypothetical protein [Gemmataceae bacterium]
LKQDPKAEPEVKPAPPKAKVSGNAVRMHAYGGALLWEGGDSFPLTSGLVVNAGGIKVTGFRSDQDLPVAAWLIPADESAMYPGTPTGPTVDGAEWVWDFSWSDVPAFGCDGILRFQDVVEPGSPPGTTTDLSISVVEEGRDPCGDDDSAGP